ncbi:hypothetical protein D3C81_1703170 [compost metagenome]
MATVGVGAHSHGRTVTPQVQRHLKQLGVLMQQAQVKLHQVPADDRIRIVPGHPLVQAVEQCRPVVAVVQVEIHGVGLAIGGP